MLILIYIFSVVVNPIPIVAGLDMKVYDIFRYLDINIPRELKVFLYLVVLDDRSIEELQM